MRVFVAALGALLLVASAPLMASAEPQPKPARASAKKATPPAESAPRSDGYREQLADKLPFGSQAWWDQMSREGRLGGERP
jgi:hypothetical protein